MTKLILCSTLIIVGMLMGSLRSEPTRVASPHAVEGTSPAPMVETAHKTTEETAPNPPSVVSSHLAELDLLRVERDELRRQLADANELNAALESENRKLKQFTAVNTVKAQPATKPQPVRYYYRPQLQYGSCGPGGCSSGRVGIFGRRR